MKNFPIPGASSKHQAGSSLLEVLIAVLILAVGMLGMAALQAVTLKNSNSSAARSQAVMQSYSMLDRLRLNRTQALSGGFNAAGCTAAAADPDGPADDTDYSVFNGWLQEVQGVLGASACGSVQCAAGQCTVRVSWDDTRATGDPQDTKPLEIETTTGL